MKKILVADDAGITRRLVSVTLMGGDYEILQASRGDEALTLAQKERPHLILLDVLMPGLDGYEVCRRLKADPATHDMVVVMLTGNTAIEDRLAAIDAGANGYLPKPFDPAQLREIVAKLIKSADDQAS